MRIPRIKSLSNDEQISRHGDATARDGAETETERTLLAVSLRIWGTTLFILALPVLGIATFHSASPKKSPPPEIAERCQNKALTSAVRLLAQDRVLGAD